MANISLIEAIDLYIEETGSFGEPKNEFEQQILNQILMENNIAKNRVLNLESLRRLGNKACSKNIHAGINFYIKLANKLGIEYFEEPPSEQSIDIEDKEENLGIETHDINNDEQIIDNREENEDMTPEEMIARGLAGILYQNKNVIVELGDDTLRNIEDIIYKNDEQEEDYEWNGVKDVEETFDEVIHGYSFEELKQILDIKKTLLLRGVPGTGKTKMMKLLLHQLTNGDRDKYKIISFSQNTDYTDFIGGLVSKNGKWVYKDGILTELCKKADSDRNNYYYLGIDELSRGNTEAILGELMTCIEHRDTIITLKNGKDFMIPSNLYIIATMNNLDGSTKKIDVATLERFYIVDILPQWKGYADAITKEVDIDEETYILLDDVCKIMEDVNELIKKSPELGLEKCIGTRAVSDIELTKDNLILAIKTHLIPEIKDRIKYCRSKREEIEEYIDSLIEKYEQVE